MYGVDVVRALAGGVQPVLGGLQRRIRHRTISNFINKMSQFSRYCDVDLWNKVVERRADDEVDATMISSGVAGATPLDVQEAAVEDEDESAAPSDT